MYWNLWVWIDLLEWEHVVDVAEADLGGGGELCLS